MPKPERASQLDLNNCNGTAVELHSHIRSKFSCKMDFCGWFWTRERDHPSPGSKSPYSHVRKTAM